MAQASQQPKYIVDPHQVRSPTLLIGVGGIGGQIVKGVYNAMSDYDRTYVELLVMDTNINDLDKFTDSGIRYIQTSENRTVQGYLEANEEYAKWFPVNPLINAKNLSQGAGQIRSVSRLGALASKADGRFSAIDDAIDRILTNHGDTLVRAVRVMVVGSATGGTGSGLGVQLPFYVRNVLESKNVPNVLIRGMFLMPSLTEDVQDTDEKEKAVNVNGYAFLKEVNAFYHAQKIIAEDNMLSIEEYVPGVRTLTDGGMRLASAAPVPYDFLFLVEKYGNRGSIGNLGDYIERSAQIVMNQLFSPIADRGFSAEDNLITSAVPTGGMNRYCGAGIANAVYPKDEVVSYCTVRYASELIKGYWLQVDDEFNRLDQQQRLRKMSDPSIAALDRGATFCKIFDDMRDPEKRTVSSELATLGGELNVRVTHEEGENTITEDRPLVECMVNYIEEFLDAEFEKTKLTEQAEGCKMDRTVLQDPKNASVEVSEKMGNLKNLKEAAESKINSMVLSTADDILPANLELAMSSAKGARHNIYVTLCKKHPIVVRYVLYALRDRLQSKKAENDSLLEEHQDHESIFKKDYFREKGGKDTQRESPTEALSKTPAGFLAPVVTSAAYTTLIGKIIRDASDEAAHIRNKAEQTLKSSTYRIVLDRMDTLIALYEMFFEELRDIMVRKADEAKRLEAGKGSGLDKDFKGDKYICSNAECKRFLYDQFQSSVTDAELEMSDEVKKGFFDKMFEEYTTRLAEEANSTAYVTHLSLSQLFEQGILEPITAQFQKKGFRHLDMSILEAIRKQFEIENRNTEKAKNESEFKQYFTALCGNLRILATPYLSYDLEVPNYRSGGKLTYAWGLNHSAVARYQNGTVEKGVNQQVLDDMFKSKESAVTDDSFSPYEMVCYAAIYDLRAENCKMYKRGQKAEKCYSGRLKNLVNQSYVISDQKDGYLETIHPHLDYRWHEHAYLPELMAYDNDALSKKTRQAFMLSLCLGLCDYHEEKEEALTCWWYRLSSEKTAKPVSYGGKALRSESIFAVYKAFDCNRAIVEDVETRIEGMEEKAYANLPETGATFEIVVQQPVIQALIGKTGGKRNVLDLLYNLMLNSGNRKDLDLNLTDLESYLYNYCYKMMNENDNKAAVMSEAVRKAIGAASKILTDPNGSRNFKESCASFL